MAVSTQPHLPLRRCPRNRVENKEGVFSGSKVVSDAAGAVLLRCKKSPLSRAKWTLTDGRSGGVVCKTKTIAGMVKIAVEAAFPGRRETLLITPNFEDLSRRVHRQCLAKCAAPAHKAAWRWLAGHAAR